MGQLTAEIIAGPQVVMVGKKVEIAVIGHVTNGLWKETKPIIITGGLAPQVGQIINVTRSTFAGGINYYCYKTSEEPQKDSRTQPQR